MPQSLFVGNVIAVIWDFDQTLIPGYQQDPLFAEYDIDGAAFWAEVRGLGEYYSQRGLVVSHDTLYLNHILTYVRLGRMPGLTNAKLRELGGRLQFYPGLPNFLERCRDDIEKDARYLPHEIVVEHYIVSSGLRQMILGSAVAAFVRDIWASEFIEEAARPGFLDEPGDAAKSSEVTQVGYFLDNTTKTRAIWEINKGTNVHPEIGVNDQIALEDRRVPLRNMLYIADGPSDIPVFSILNQYGGRTLGVYNPNSSEHFLNVKKLQDQGRVQHFAEANYVEGTNAYQWIMASLREIADAIAADRQVLLRERVHPSVGHVN